MLGILLALTIFVTFCDAQCTFYPLQITPGGGPEGCRDPNGRWFSFGTESESNCIRCSCRQGVGLSCCNTVIRPKSYDKVKCVEKFNKFTCTVFAVQKANPAVACKVTKYVG
ncbi:beta-microseminoprotein-like [Phascolarctos cinereus]